MRDLSSEDSWQMLKQMYSEVVDMHVPKKKSFKKHKPKWMKSSVKKAVKKKSNLYMRALKIIETMKSTKSKIIGLDRM